MERTASSDGRPTLNNDVGNGLDEVSNRGSSAAVGTWWMSKRMRDGMACVNKEAPCLEALPDLGWSTSVEAYSYMKL